MSHRLITGDCLEVMPTLDADSIDSIVTDPPYGLSFMGKDWDHGVPGEAFWCEALRVAKPGAHLLAFGGTRTFHRLAVAIEDAGWEIRDTMMWVFGSGFPKSLDCAKAIQGSACQEFARDVHRLSGSAEGYPASCSDSCRQCGEPLPGEQEPGQGAVPQLGDAPSHSRLSGPLAQTLEGIGHRYTAFHAGLSSHLSTLDCQGRKDADAWQLVLEAASFLCPACFAQSIQAVSDCVTPEGDIDWSSIDAPSVVTAWATSESLLRNWRIWSEPYSQYITEAKRWQGWGTALKPAWEPVILARKPLVGTVAANVLAHGTGALNIDGCRVGTEPLAAHGGGKGNGYSWNKPLAQRGDNPHVGRWPANIVHDGSDDVTALFPETIGGVRPARRNVSIFGAGNGTNDGTRIDYDSGSAARFFYCAKASKADRDEGCEGLAGRWPANIVHDGSDEVLELFPNTKAGKWNRTKGARHFNNNGEETDYREWKTLIDSGSAARFFYCAKASKADRDEGCEALGERAGKRTLSGGADTRGRPTPVNCNPHPTVKPTALMRYLCRLITPPGGVILDPFCGSGSTGKAATLEGFDFIGIDTDADYLAIAEARIAAVTRQEVLAL